MIYGWIYKLYCLDTREIYIGSTKNLKKRISDHKCDSREISKNVCYSKQIINRNNYIFLILQEGFYVNKDHLKFIENNYIEKLPCINCVPSISNSNTYFRKYHLKNKTKKNLYSSNYRENNKEKLAEWKRTKKTCEICFKQTDQGHYARHLKSCMKKQEQTS